MSSLPLAQAASLRPVFLRMRLETSTSCARLTQRLGDRGDLGRDLAFAVSVHHREQVIGPERRVTRAVIAVGDERQPADTAAEIAKRRILDVPNRHRVVREPERVMVRHGADAPDDAVLEHSLEARHDRFGTHPERVGQRVVGPRHQRQAGLRGADDRPVDGIDALRHAATLKPIKNSSILGKA